MALVAVPAPEVPPERLFDVVAGERLLLDGASTGDAVVAGVGAAARIDGGRQALGIAIDAEGMGDDEEARRVAARFYGGLAFPGGAGWQGFGSASFVLPRVLYVARGARSFVRAVVPRGGSLLEARRELEGIAAGLEARPPSSPAPVVAFEPNEPHRRSYLRLVEEAKRAIARGELQKVVVARRRTGRLSAPFHLGATLGRLRSGNPEATLFAVERGTRVFFGATPERLVAQSRGSFSVDVLAGSIPRRGNSATERAVLQGSEKDAREHEVVAAAVEESLAPLVTSAERSVRSVVTLPTVHHLRLRIEGRARPGAHVLDLVEALHPTPAVGGTPRAPALAFLREHEGFERGWYAGAVGWFDAEGDGSFSVAIRSASVERGTVHLFVGAGIVGGSDPEREWEETEAKERTALHAIGVEGSSEEAAEICP